MTKITIVPENPGRPDSKFRASAQELESVGQTPGAALDGITKQLTAEEAGTLIVVQSMHPDMFFTAAQQKRLGELMAKWHEARDCGRKLDIVEQTELEALVEAELDASGKRADAIAKELLS